MGKPISINHDDKLIKIEGHPVTRVQSFGYDTNINSEDLYEIGNENIVETRVDDIITTTTNFTTNDWGTTDLLGQLMGEHQTIDGRKNLAVITETELQKAEVDITIPVLENDTWKRSVWLPNQHLTSFTFSYDVNGNGTEQYTLEGDEDYDFPESYREVESEKGTYASSTTFTVSTSATGKTGRYISVNNIIYDSSVFTWGGTTVTVSTVSGVASLTSSDRIRLIYTDDTPASSFTKLNTAGLASVRGGQIKIGLGSSSVVDSAHKTLRVQSVSVNGTIARDENKELGTKQIIGRSWQNTTIEITVTVDASDLQEYAYFAGVSEADWNNWSSSAIILNPSKTIGNNQELMIQIYDDSDQNYLLKTEIFSNLRFVGKGSTHDVQGKEQVTYTLRGSAMTISGNGVPSGSKLAGANVYPSIWVE